MSWPSPTQSWLKDQVLGPSLFCSQETINRSSPPGGGTGPRLCERLGALCGLRDPGRPWLGQLSLLKPVRARLGQSAQSWVKGEQSLCCGEEE